MNKIIVKRLIGQNGESFGAYVDYNDFCKMKREYEEQIKKMKCGENCKHSYNVNTGGCYDMKCRLTYCDCINCDDKWELAK